MANHEHVQILKEGCDTWNRWREQNPDLKPDLTQLNFEGIREVCVVGPDLSYFNLAQADLRMTSLRNGGTMNASFREAYMVGADLCFGTFANCDFRGANLRLSRLGSAEFASCDFTGADLAYCTAEETSFAHSKLELVDLRNMQLVATDFSGASLRGAQVHGIAAWDVKLSDTNQSDLIITPPDTPSITVDDLELAQFVYLLLKNSRLRDVLDTINSKVVLILGKFTPERKVVLDAIRAELRRHDLVPILFDFERPASRSFIETASVLAHIARFVIADFTDEGDVRREVHHIATSLPRVPIVPLLHSQEESLPLTLQDLGNHPGMIPLVRYRDVSDLLDGLLRAVIEPALALEERLRLPGRES